MTNMYYLSVFVSLHLILSSPSGMSFLTLDHYNLPVDDLEVITPLSEVVLTDG